MVDGERYPRYSVGDIVQIVDEPYERCPFGWIRLMDGYCGRTAAITCVYWHPDLRAWAYEIDIDKFNCLWCEGCFASDFNEDIGESDINFNDLFT